MVDKGRFRFISGANAAISRDMITTSEIIIGGDMAMIKELKFNVKML